MNDFAPRYHTPDPNPKRPPLPWAAWGLINIVWLATFNFLFGMVPDFELHLAAIFVVAPAFAAGLFDGRMRMVAVLTLSGWAVLMTLMVMWSNTDAWHQDCGLGVGFAMLFAAIGAAAYPAVVAVLFGIGSAIRTSLGLVEEWTED